MSVHQADLDHIAERLSRLALDDLICISVNALAQHGDNTSRLAVLTRIKTVMVTASAMFGYAEKIQCCEMLRDAADLFERAVLTNERTMLN